MQNIYKVRFLYTCMFFKAKKLSCLNCKEKIQESFSFCPTCGTRVKIAADEQKDYGLLGRTDMTENPAVANNLGFADKLITGVLAQVMKSMEQQLNNGDEHAEIQHMPNGIQIKIGPQVQRKRPQKQKAQEITAEQLEKMAQLPRAPAKTSLTRLADKVLYEAKMPGIQHVNDVIISKVESGYEVKAIGKNKVFTSTLPINLPLKSYTLKDKSVVFEFGLQ